MPAEELTRPKNKMSAEEMKAFIRNHFEEFLNRQNLAIGDVNFAADFIDHGADVPPGTPPGPAGAEQYVGSALKKIPDPARHGGRRDRRGRQSSCAQHLARH